MAVFVSAALVVTVALVVPHSLRDQIMRDRILILIKVDKYLVKMLIS